MLTHHRSSIPPPWKNATISFSLAIRSLIRSESCKTLTLCDCGWWFCPSYHTTHPVMEGGVRFEKFGAHIPQLRPSNLPSWVSIESGSGRDDEITERKKNRWRPSFRRRTLLRSHDLVSLSNLLPSSYRALCPRQTHVLCLACTFPGGYVADDVLNSIRGLLCSRGDRVNTKFNAPGCVPSLPLCDSRAPDLSQRRACMSPTNHCYTTDHHQLAPPSWISSRHVCGP